MIQQGKIIFSLVLESFGLTYCQSCSQLIKINIIGEQAKRARHYQGCTNSRNCICVYIVYIYGRTWGI